MKSLFNSSVMMDDLIRLCLEQFAEQGNLIECRDALYRIYRQLDGADPDAFAKRLTAVCDSITAAMDAVILPSEGLHLLLKVRGMLRLFPNRDLFRDQLRNQCAIELKDYFFICDCLSAIGLTLYDPISFENSGRPSRGGLSSAVLNESIERVSKSVLLRDSLCVKDLIKGDCQVEYNPELDI